MSSRTRHLTLATLLAATASATGAHAQTSFTAHRLGVSGNTNFDATALNGSGDIVGTVFDGSGSPTGVIVHHGTVTTLPAPYSNSGAALPQAINSHGDVLGYTYEGYQPIMFLWQNGKYNQDVSQIPLEIEQQAGPPPLPIGLNGRDEIFYTIITGMQNTSDPIYGKISNLHGMPYLLRYQTAHSINQARMISGNAFNSPASEVFVGKKKNDFTVLLPPGASSSAGGFVNNKGEVGGTWTDASNVQHGFTWLGGSYTSFDVPEQAQPYSVYVTGINDDGRVVGIYTSTATNKTHAFLWNGSTVSTFGSYQSFNAVSVSINAHGEMLVSVQIKSNAANYASYHVVCSGSGC